MATLTAPSVLRRQKAKLVHAATGASAAPSAVTDGMSLQVSSNPNDGDCDACLIVLRSTVGTSFTAAVWLFDATSQLWVLDTTLGTAGTITTTTATNGGTQFVRPNVSGFLRVYVQVLGVVGVGEVADVWATGLQAG